MLALLAQVTTEVEPFVDVNTWLILLGVITPFVTALLTHVHTSDSVKGFVSAVVTALVAFVVTALETDGTWPSSREWFNGWMQILLFHAGSYFMLTSKPVAALNARTPGVIGGGEPQGPITNTDAP